jgi:hypothetical protein
LWHLLSSEDKEMMWRYIQCLMVIDGKIPEWNQKTLKAKHALYF